MNEFKGTPGKWCVGLEGEILSDAGYIVIGTELVHGNDSDLDLIAAAPELLEALQDVLLAFEEVLLDEYSTEPQDNEYCVKAHAAINKALGLGTDK